MFVSSLGRFACPYRFSIAFAARQCKHPPQTFFRIFPAKGFFAARKYAIIRLVMEFHYEIRPGRYRHFKGNEYEVLGMARHSETEEEMVVYRALYGERGLWVRPAAMWCETVERDGRVQPRFVRIEE